MRNIGADVTGGSVSLTVEAVSLLSYAMAHNRVPVVNRITIANHGGAIRAAALRVSVGDALGVIGAAQEIVVDLEAASPTVLSDVRLLIDPAAMSQVEEQRPGVVSVTLSKDGVTLAETHTEITLLAAQQWLARPVVLSLELLAAFVMPNHPAITVLVREAADILAADTANSSMAGYQSGAEHVDAVVEAMYVAMQRRRIRYATPPASWADIGQKVRTPEEVLEGRLGTCLDTVVVMAAALEQVGIRPLVWVVDGHAFLGYWRIESALDAVAQTEVADVVNRVDLGQIRLVETTALVVSAETTAFADTHRTAYNEYLTGSMERVVGVTDVWRARRNGIIPLPARVRAPDGSVTVVAYHPPEPRSWGPPTGGASPTAVRAARVGVRQSGPVVPPRIEQWKNALLDLSLRNRLINFAERTSIGLAVPEQRLAQFEDALNDGSPISLLPADQLAQVQLGRGVRLAGALPQDQLIEMLSRRRSVYIDVPADSYDARLGTLGYKARTIVEETGANNLYVALGSLVWRHEDRDLRSPLILVPVHLTGSSRQRAFRIALDESGASTPNYCLLEKLRQVHGLVVPALAAPPDDDSGIDLDAAMRAVREALLEAGLPFRVEDTAHLAVLQFAKFRLWKDLDEGWQTMLENPLVRHLVGSPNEAFADPVAAPDPSPDLDELSAACPVAGDASQLGAVAAAVAGRTFVLEGPPGTGKSQTITNLLARAIGDGKRMLFVAEKRAALDVVKNRLDAVGLGALALDLHDKSSKPSEVRLQIRAALEHQVAVDAQGAAADAGELRSAGAVLSRYADRLHAPNAAGMSLYGAHAALLALRDRVPALVVPAALLTSATSPGHDRLRDIRRLLAKLPDTADVAQPGRFHPWRFLDTTGAADMSVEMSVESVRSLAAAFDEAIGQLPASGPLTDLLAAAQSSDALQTIATVLPAAPIGLDLLDETRTTRWRTEADAIVADIAAFTAAPHPEMNIVTPAALHLPLADIDAQARAAAESGFFGRKRRLVAVRSQLSAVMRPGESIEPKRLTAVTASLAEAQMSVLALTARVNAVAGLAVPVGWNPLTDDGARLVEGRVRRLQWLGAVVDDEQDDETQARLAGAIRVVLASSEAVAPLTIDAIRRASDAAVALMTACGASKASQVHWADGIGLVARWNATRSARELASGTHQLQRWTTFVAELDPLASAGLGDARRMLLDGTIRAEDAALALERGVAETSVGERRASTGLGAFDAAVHERTIGRFVRSAAAVRTSMNSVIPEQVLARRSFDQASVHGQVGALHRELAKQRRGMGVRSLLHSYGELITQVMPCVLVSPDSLARFFPVTAGLFDTVVFDEASQIRVADAVGAMGRARSVVVVGDSKQMPPTSFAEPGTVAGADVGDARTPGADQPVDDDGAVEDEESILSECVQARVQRQWLTWHYRSQDESLIAFSNQQYYENRLSSFPAPGDRSADAGGEDDGAGDGRGVSLVRVDGVFHRSGVSGERSTNPIEAEAIVDEIARRFAASPDRVPSIGVVTFNIQQRTLIEKMLNDSDDERIIAAMDGRNGEGLFVKNLENVQGDERDVVLFSTAFSVNARGSLPLNFGPLNREGGERRLNVAITRARRQVVVFSSFDPEQLRAEETSSVGIKHLRAYLDMAKYGTAVLASDTRQIGTVDRHREDIADALRQRGVFVRTDVGLSGFRIDLSIASVERPERQLVAVLLDGPAWAIRRTVGDRDGLPVDVLSHLMHWPAVERVWLPAWLDDREAVLDGLLAAFDAALFRPRPPAAPPDTLQAVVPDTLPAAVPDLLQAFVPDTLPAVVAATVTATTSAARQITSDATTTAASTMSERTELEVWFVAWPERRLGESSVIDDLPAPTAAMSVSAAIADIVAAEGPIHLDRLARLTASAFGVHRLTAARKADILAQLPPNLQPSHDESFVWPETIDQATWRLYRRSDADDERPIEHVSRAEIVNAMSSLCASSAGMTEPELKRETLAVFGGKRVTAGIDAELGSMLEAAIGLGRLRRRADGLITAVM